MYWLFGWLVVDMCVKSASPAGVQVAAAAAARPTGPRALAPWRAAAQPCRPPVQSSPCLTRSANLVTPELVPPNWASHARTLVICLGPSTRAFPLPLPRNNNANHEHEPSLPTHCGSTLTRLLSYTRGSSSAAASSGADSGPRSSSIGPTSRSAIDFPAWPPARSGAERGGSEGLRGGGRGGEVEERMTKFRSAVPPAPGALMARHARAGDTSGP